jgi:heme o synthase
MCLLGPRDSQRCYLMGYPTQILSVAPPLILLGAPALPILRGLPQSVARGVAGPILRSAPVKWLGRLATHPALCWLAATFALIGWHVPAGFQLALRWDWLHELEHATFLGTGLLFWWPVVQPWPSAPRWPRWSIPLYLFCATLPCDALSAFLAFCDRVVYSSYLSEPSVFGISALQDQQCAAALMWTCITIILLVPAVLVTLEILSPYKVRLPEQSWAELEEFSEQPLHISKLEVPTETMIAVLVPAPTARRNGAVRLHATLADYWALTKPEVNFLILVTTFAGFYLASAGGLTEFRILRVIHTLTGTLLVAGGTGTLNQFLERFFDSQMRRTSRRPLASGRLKASHVLWFGISLSITGAIYLALAVNALASVLAVLTLISYLFVYTPLKRKTPLCTLIGAFPGAIPPLIGWAAARGRLDPEAWVLYAMVFLWQFPHFMAIAWMYREDYARAGYLVLPRGKLRDRFVIMQSFVVSLALLPVTLMLIIWGESGLVYSAGALILGSIFLYYSARFAFHRSNVVARQLLAASIAYLPLLFILLVLDKK